MTNPVPDRPENNSPQTNEKPVSLVKAIGRFLAYGLLGVVALLLGAWALAALGVDLHDGHGHFLLGGVLLVIIAAAGKLGTGVATMLTGMVLWMGVVVGGIFVMADHGNPVSRVVLDFAWHFQDADGPDSPGLVRRFDGHRGWINDMAVSPSTGELVTAGADGRIIFWNYEDGSIRRILDAGGDPVQIEFSRDGLLLAARVQESSVRVWDAKTGQEADFIGRNEVTSIAFMAQSPNLLLAYRGGDLVLRDILSGKVSRTVRARITQGDVASTRSGKFILSADYASDNTRLNVWHGADGTFAGPFGKPTERISPPAKLALNEREDTIATVTSTLSPQLVVWDVATQAPSSFIFVPGGYVNHVQFSPDGTMLTVGGYRVPGLIWRPQKSDKPILITGHKGGVHDAVFSRDTKYLFTGDGSGTVHVWDVRQLLGGK